jgi:hypothetical protein
MSIKQVPKYSFQSAWENLQEEEKKMEIAKAEPATIKRAYQMLPKYMHGSIKNMHENELRQEIAIEKRQRSTMALPRPPARQLDDELGPLELSDPVKPPCVQLKHVQKVRFNEVEQQVWPLQHIGIFYDKTHPKFRDQSCVSLNKGPGMWVDTVCFHNGTQISADNVEQMVPVKIIINYTTSYEEKVRERNAFYRRRQTCLDV